MRYVWASIVAVAVILAGFLFVRQTRAYAEKKLREQHSLPADVASNHGDVGLEVSGSEMACISAADALISFPYVFIVLVILLCFGTAAGFGRRQPASGQTAPPSEQ
jgi:hypothetical protein